MEHRVDATAPGAPSEPVGNLPVAVLFKDPPVSGAEDAYTPAFARDLGLRAVHVPLLATTDVLAPAESWLPAGDAVPVHIVTTSRRASAALARVLAQTTEPRNITVWAVGPATARPLTGLPGVTIRGTDAGDAAALATQLLAAPDLPASLIVLRGDKSLETVPTRLRAAGVGVREVPAYATGAREAWWADLPQSARWWVCFSPSGVDILCTRFPAGPLPEVRVAAIGETTAARVREMWPRARLVVAPRPCAEGVVQAIRGDGE
ncbi:uroporphyrinogen-III synthase [Blastocladiella emersonii ATCC 22665]|nr:uroporphyrinogen-III synthase [Blastocladiella emersonii ATCC 22665]